uniref:Calponin domain-containing protein n=1 Tax=Noctiluca scintillans TaxID=2966 RepID=A7WQ46_NOCSC|nr:calponin domain-containing protein [Noctiluca scintillans]
MSELNYGIDDELKQKQEASYDKFLEKRVVDWIEQITGSTKGDQEVAEWLHDGKVLCELVNKIQPGTVKKINDSSLPFKQMENITYFMNAARAIGVPEMSMFATPDLYEAKNMGSVINCINNYGGFVQSAVPEFDGPKLGNEVKAEVHDVRRDKTKVDQSAGLSGTMEIERPRYGGVTAGATAGKPQEHQAAGQVAGSQTRPRSPIPTADHAGLDADLAAKMAEKEAALAGVKAEVVDWIQTVSGSSIGDASFAEWLHDGKVLCALINAIKPGAIPKVNQSTLAFKQMENITYFMNAARDMGVPESSMFGTPDLYEEKNIGSVIQCIYTLGGAVQVNVPEFTGPKLGTPLHTQSSDKKREDALCMDQSEAYQRTMQVERPKDLGITRGAH